MILILTLNPMLEYRLRYHEVVPGASHRSPAQVVSAGGKGINVSRQLHELGTPSLNYTFTGGNNGRMFRDLLAAEGLQVTAVKTASETRIGFVVAADAIPGVTTFFGADTVLTPEDVAAFTGKLEKMISNCEVLVLSGSSPHPLAGAIFPAALRLAADMDKISVLDTYGPHLEDCLNAGPVVLHNNCDELSRSLGVPLATEEEKIACVASLHGRGIKQICLTDGGNPAIASSFGYAYRVAPPEVTATDPTGSGDSFVAGMVYGIVHGYSFEDSLRLGTALGAVNAASFSTSRAPVAEARALLTRVGVVPVGAKVNAHDVPRVL